jgi:hypothetical protein
MFSSSNPSPDITPSKATKGWPETDSFFLPHVSLSLCLQWACTDMLLLLFYMVLFFSIIKSWNKRI